jgi:hypothetical protein
VPLLVRFLLSHHHTAAATAAAPHHVIASVVYQQLRLDDAELKRLLERARMMCTHKPVDFHSHLHCCHRNTTSLQTLIDYFITQLGEWNLVLMQRQPGGGSRCVAVRQWQSVDLTHVAPTLEDLYSLITESELVEPGGSARVVLKNIPTLAHNDPKLSDGNAEETQLKCSIARILCCLITANAMDLGYFHFQRLS